MGGGEVVIGAFARLWSCGCGVSVEEKLEVAAHSVTFVLVRLKDFMDGLGSEEEGWGMDATGT